ncbi:unnamed protein product [Nippostrongylus brasiliensis]|uniref:Neur_chan_memb domain-containing protein n=1 Tax=Nippostrongylus brasiliensis TaxID=27835 RepID=A0A0N4YCN6_NIPBR|nr:unnamed protein product [Nippostrongylus brasiliensis]
MTKDPFMLGSDASSPWTSICAHMEKEEREERVQADWKFAAMAVDRACLIMFTVFIVLSTVTIFLSAPHIVA